MAEPSLQLGNGNWAGKSDNLLAYHKANNNFYADELTFARASTGTIVNADGLIEQVPYNLLQYSEQLDNAAWSTSLVTVTANTTISPDGTQNADTIDAIAINQRINQAANVTASTIYTFSFYAKKGTMTTPKYTLYDLSNSAGISVRIDYSSLINSSTWSRVTATFTTPVGCSSVGCYVINGVDTLGTIYIWGAQLNTGSTAKTYYPTTTRLNVPRVDYLNNSKGSLLLEPQRTNAFTQSNNFGDSVWVKNDVTIVGNSISSPDGSVNASKIIPNTNNVVHRVQFLGSQTATYSISVYAKAAGYDRLVIAASNLSYSVFNLTTGTESHYASIGVSSRSIESVGNGWYRCTVVGSSNSGASISFLAYNADLPSGNPTFSGDGTSGVYIYGAQVEAGSYSTSYIPTSGTTATRNLDSFSNAGNASAFNDSEGVLYAEIGALDNDQTNRIISINGANTNDAVRLQYSTASLDVRGVVVVGGSNAAVLTYAFSSEAEMLDFNKIALKYKENDFALWVNGVEVSTHNSGTAFPASTLLTLDSQYGGSNFYGNVKDLQIFKTALTNTELATLTTI